MSNDYKIVVSSENSNYLAWQTQLFCFSAATRTNQWPIVIVHKSGEPLRREFSQLRQCGSQIIEAPQFRSHPCGFYPPRNELGSLLTIGSNYQGEQPILFCEPDMLFVRPIAYDASLTGEYYKYLDYREERIKTVAGKLKLEHALGYINETGKIGVPYLIPGQLVKRIATRWLQVLDAFDEFQWIDIMYAFGMSLAIEGLEAKTSRRMNDNLRPLEPLTGDLIHYCYGDALWNKRSFREGTPLDQAGYSFPDAAPGSILHEMIRQIREAREFFAAQLPRVRGRG